MLSPSCKTAGVCAPRSVPAPSRSQAPRQSHAEGLAKGRPAGQRCPGTWGQAARGATGHGAVQRPPPPALGSVSQHGTGCDSEGTRAHQHCPRLRGDLDNFCR